MMDRAKENSIKADSISYIKATNNLFTINNGSSLNPKYEGVYTVKQLDDIGVKVSGTKPSDGYLFSINNSIRYGCLLYKDYKVVINNNEVSSIGTGGCTLSNGYNSSVGVYFADYSGNEQTFVIPKTGKYLLEVWGAQGGSVKTEYIGGYGAYSRGYVQLEQNQILYINVGGVGTSTISYSTANAGGYNGGGSNYVINNCSNVCAPGGGATSIATVSGLLSTLSDEKDKILIVAGGGGGSAYRRCSDSDYSYSSGGNAGGFIGSSPSDITTIYTYNESQGGSQTSGGIAGNCNNESGTVNGSFGQGGNYTRTNANTCSAGGGGGFYGGGNGMFTGAGGGSGYIGNEVLTNKEMYCYDCRESIDNDKKTISTKDVYKNPTPFAAKKGQGYARITFVE